MQKIFTPRGIVKPLLIIGAVSCAVFLLDKGLGLLHTQASDKLMQCSATATDNTDKFGYSILAGIAASKATDIHMMNLTVVLDRFAASLEHHMAAANDLDSYNVLALVYLKVYQ